jgi:hypothetical protein
MNRIQCFGGPKDGQFVDVDGLQTVLYFYLTTPVTYFVSPVPEDLKFPTQEVVYKLKRSAESGDLWYVYEQEK